MSPMDAPRTGMTHERQGDTTCRYLRPLTCQRRTSRSRLAVRASKVPSWHASDNHHLQARKKNSRRHAAMEHHLLLTEATAFENIIGEGVTRLTRYSHSVHNICSGKDCRDRIFGADERQPC